MVKAVVFDVGDTLMRYSPPIPDIILAALQSSGYPATKEAAEEMYDAAELFCGEQIMREQAGHPRMPDDEFMERADQAAARQYFGIYGEPRGAFDFSYAAARNAAKPEKIVAEDAHFVLNKLKDTGRKLGIVSNYSPDLLDWLNEKDLTRYFDSIIVSGIVGIEKPDPKIMDICLNALSVDAPDALYVGDHPLDILCAKEAGMQVAWLCKKDRRLPGYIPCDADHRIETLSDLIDIVLCEKD